MQTARLRLYTKNKTYLRMAEGALGLLHRSEIEKTEQVIARYTGARHAILTSMGRMAIYEGLRALPQKGEIILSPITVPEVVSLVILAGFTPVFCDIKSGTWNMDTDLVEPLIGAETVAIMTTHFYGNTSTTAAVRALCDQYKLTMIEDAAQAAGAWNNGKHAGTTGDFGILSFSYPKNVTSFYGGCVITDNPSLAETLRSHISRYPVAAKDWLYKKVLNCAVMDIGTHPLPFQLSARIIRCGYKHNIKAIKNVVTQELNPALLKEVPHHYLTQLSAAQAKAIADKWPEIDEDAEHRIACAKIYSEHLAGLAEVIACPPANDKSNTYLYFPVQVEDKYALQSFMIERGCDVAIQHAQNCADLQAYAAFHRDCPNARAAYKGTLMLPTYRGFPLKRAAVYAQTIRAFFGKT